MPETIDKIELPDTARERYLRYAMSVITSRALPDVRDGLKPVQRRILYAMEVDLGLRPDARPMKSAKVVGGVMSNYHPHGDSAIYDAMVRMAQDFSLRYPLVTGQGNFGAITGDNAAAFRYTEAKLAPLGHELMATLGEATVAMRPNYDGTSQEPEVLPVPVPLILLNGSTGIAVGMATNIPPHNLKEVVKATTALIDNPDATVAQLLRSIKGPDFPTGGEILSTRDELRQVYETGRGTIKVRGTYAVEETKEERQRVARRSLVFTSIPYGTTTAQIIAKIKDLLDGKKLPNVGHVSDQTTEDDGVRIVLELKSDADATLIAAALYKLTPLESSFGVNLTCLFPTGGPAGRPAQADLKTILRAWLDFRFDVVTRSITFRRDRLKERIHILEGLTAVLDGVDAAIKLVRAAKDRDDAKQKLMKRFSLDEAQVEAVLEIRLYRLAQLEVQKVEVELTEKRAEVKRLEKLLATPKPRWDLIKKELEEYAERKDLGDARRTKVKGEDEEHAFDPTALVKREDTHVLVSRDGRLKRVTKLGDPTKIRLRDEDELLAILQGSTLAAVALFTNHGSAYVMAIHDVPQTAGFGDPAQKFFSFADGERIVAALSLDPRLAPAPGARDAVLLVATAQGNVAQVPLDPHREPSTKAGRKLVKLGEGDEVVAVEVPASKHLLLATLQGYALRAPVADVPALAGAGKGKRAIALEKKDRVIGATTRGPLKVETTRGAQDEVAPKDVSVGALGDAGVVVKQRGGFKRVLPSIELVALPETAGDGAGE